MKIDKYWKLRLRKWWITKVVYWAYKDLPFDIAYTNMAEKYEPINFGEVIIEFDIPERYEHYVIYRKTSIQKLPKGLKDEASW